MARLYFFICRLMNYSSLRRYFVIVNLHFIVIFIDDVIHELNTKMNENTHLNDTKCETAIEMEDANAPERNQTEKDNCCYRNCVECCFLMYHCYGVNCLGCCSNPLWKPVLAVGGIIIILALILYFIS